MLKNWKWNESKLLTAVGGYFDIYQRFGILKDFLLKLDDKD